MAAGLGGWQSALHPLFAMVLRKKSLGVVKPLLLDEGPILRDEAEFLGRALIDKFLMIVIMSWLFTCPISFRAQFFIFALHRALYRDRDRMIV